VRRMRRAILVATTLALLAPAGAGAAFPGVDGRICYTSDRDGNGNLFSIFPDGSDFRRLTTDPADDAQCAWSPDGNRIAFRAKRDGHYEVYVMNADGSNQTRLTTTPQVEDPPPPSDEQSSQPSWSADANRMLFRSNRDGDYDIWAMNADGTSQTQVLNDPGDERYPGFSPDCGRIVFRSDRDGDTEIYVMNADGTAVVQLTSNDIFDSAPAWSPDGTQIAFERSLAGRNPDGSPNREGNGDGYPTDEIWVMKADGTNQRQLTDNSAHDEGPAWSPDGTQIVFTSERDGNSEIYVMNADGTDQRRFTNDPALDESPDWGPQPGTVPRSCGDEPGGGGDGSKSPPGSTARNVLHALRLHPTRFHARHSGGSISRRGIRVRYRLDIPATVIFSIDRIVARRSAAKPLTKKLTGTFRHSGREGTNEFRFTGRLRGKRLTPGQYYLVATPQLTGTKTVSHRVRFRILRG
jgi:Tol biopolymer transport system component